MKNNPPNEKDVVIDGIHQPEIKNLEDQITYLNNNDYEIHGLFPTPVYRAHRKGAIPEGEEKEIKDIIEEGMEKNLGNSRTIQSYVFGTPPNLHDTRLKKLKQFCEKHIDTYVRDIFCPATEKNIDFYITQSWINITKPGEHHHLHTHVNSLISGVFYISTQEDDKIIFHNKDLPIMEFDPRERNLFNSLAWWFPVKNNDLVLFPSDLRHSVEPNENATKDRMSLSFNVFVKGKIGSKEKLCELILQ